MKDILKTTVSIGDRIVGTIQMTPQRNRCVFEYDKSWIADGFSISPFELPLQTGLIYSKEGSFNGGFATFEDSLPDGYGLYLLDRMLRREGSSLKELSPLQRLSLVGHSGMGALCYKPEVKAEAFDKISEEDFDDIQQKALDVLSEKSDADASLLYYNSNNSGGARPKAAYKDKDGDSWIIKFRHTYDPTDIGKSEYLYMSTAKKCGINIPDIQLINDKYFAIKRFDISDGIRVHTLTASALLQSDFRIQGIDYINLLALTGRILGNIIHQGG
ncbi:MAG: type II toxin-antitoxin system HipA family toxin, partial [Bacteroidales bacterium]|nr:type II toxin-antitoxin system HipA family toxin [Bacteroidales bacterium]